MKYFTFIMFLFLSFNFVYSQEPIWDKQFMIGVDGVSLEYEVNHTIEPIGTYWEIDDNEDWIISSDPLGESSTITTVGNSDFNSLDDWDGWNWFWLNSTPPDKDWGLGFYKVTNDYNSTYFYIDCRVDEFGEGGIQYLTPDFWVYLNASGDDYHYSEDETPEWIDIEENEVVRIWDVHGLNPPSSNTLGSFWINVLVLIDGGGNYPRIAWGPHPSFSTTHFYIYRAVSTIPPDYKNLTFYHIGTTGSTTWEFIDNEIEYGELYTHSAYYYIKAYNSSSQNYSSASNSVLTYGEYFPQKISGETPKEIQVDEFKLIQNYPNPFNPATMIQFSIKNKSFAIWKIYEILGKEVAVLLNDVVEAGDHSLAFDATDLPSGIYMYQLQAEGIILTKKMILLR